MKEPDRLRVEMKWFLVNKMAGTLSAYERAV